MLQEEARRDLASKLSKRVAIVGGLRCFSGLFGAMSAEWLEK